MAYFENTKLQARKYRGKSPGLRLAAIAVRREFSVQRIAACTGATRQTIYGWFRGRNVSPVYRPRVNSLSDLLETAKDGEQAWSTACKLFNLSH